KCEHAAQSIGRLEGSQRKKEVDEAVTAREHTVAEPAEQPVDEALLALLEKEIASDDRPRREQVAIKHVRAQVRMVMAVEPCGVAAIKPPILIDLRRNYIFERSDQARMKHDARERASQV